MLDIAPSYLSTVLKGGKNLSYETAATIAMKLQLSTEETEYFCLLVQMESTKNPEIRGALLERARSSNPDYPVNDLSIDHFKIISNWQHFAILVTTTLTGFEATPRQIALALGQPQAEIELALERLERLEMVEKDERGRYSKVQENPRVISQSPNESLRNYHRQTLQKAIESLEAQSPQEKVIGSETFAIEASQLEQFRALTDEFFDRALALAKKSKKKELVYHLGVQFFNLTPELKTKKKRSKS